MNTTPVKKKTVGRPAKATRTERPKRIPMSGSRKRMHVEKEDQDSNFHYGWINDQKDLIYRAIRAGYVHVPVSELPHWKSPDVDAANSSDSNVSMRVGGDVVAFLMKQPMEFFEEDQRAKQEVVDGREADMKKDLNSRQDGKYGNVEIS